MKCDQCDSNTINGVYVHETGCPNVDKRTCTDCGCPFKSWKDWSGYEQAQCHECYTVDEEAFQRDVE